MSLLREKATEQEIAISQVKENLKEWVRGWGEREQHVQSLEAELATVRKRLVDFAREKEAVLEEKKQLQRTLDSVLN